MKTLIALAIFILVSASYAERSESEPVVQDPPEINDCVEKGYAIDSAGAVYEGYDIDTTVHGPAVCFKSHAEQKALKKCQQLSPNPPCSIPK